MSGYPWFIIKDNSATVIQREPCTRCAGTGKEPAGLLVYTTQKAECTTCGGSGIKPKEQER
jgi:DnaJ-class molecular chaperone